MTASPCTVRPARPEEAEAVAALVRALNADQGDPQRFAAADARAVFFGPAAPRGVLLVAEAEAGALVGYATALPAYESGWAARGWYVADLYVAPEARRRGVGRALLAALAAEAKRRGETYLWWVAKAGNARAHGFYRGLGCAEEEVRAFALTSGAFDRLAAEGAAQ